MSPYSSRGLNGSIVIGPLIAMAILHGVLLCSFSISSHLLFPPLVSSDVPSQVRLPALQAIMLLMPDEHREALQVLLLFLREVASYSETNQVCHPIITACLTIVLADVIRV